MDAGQDIAEGRYRLVERLGVGGMAEVWRAWDARLRVWRAIKVLHASSGASLLARFDNEARTMARLRHPHLLAVHDVGWDGQQPFLVMDLLPGGSLEDQRRRLGRFPPRAAARLLASVLDGLAVAHAAGVVHRDVKPHNVLIEASGSPVLADFGIARVADDRSNPTRTGMALGTLAYMAPEQRTHARSVDGRADLYAAGATLVALLTGADPYDLHVDAALAEQLRDVPPPLAEVITRATRWEPDHRYPDAATMAAALRAVADQLPDEAPVDLSYDVASPAPPDTSATYAEEGATTWGVEAPPPPEAAPSAPRPSRVGLAALGGALGLGALAAAALMTRPGGATFEPLDLSDLPLGAALAPDGATLVGLVRDRIADRPVGGGALAPWPTDVPIDDFELAGDGASALARLADGSFARVRRDGAVEPIHADAGYVWPEPDGERLLLLRAEGLFLSGPDGVRRVVRTDPDETIADVAWSGDGQRALLGVTSLTSRGREARVDLVEVATGERASSVALPGGILVESVAFVAPDRAWVGGTDTRGEARLWDVGVEATGLAAPLTLRSFPGAHDARIDGVGAGRALVVAERWERDVWVLDGEAASPAAAEPEVTELAGDFHGDELLYTRVVRDGGRILPEVRVAGRDGPLPGGEDGCWPTIAGEALVWWRLSGETCELQRRDPGADANVALFSVDAEPGATPCGFLACDRAGGVCVTSDGTSMVRFDPATGERRALSVAALPNGQAFDLDPTGQRLAILRDGAVELHPLGGGSPTTRLLPPGLAAKQLAWSAQGDALWVAGTCDMRRDCLGRLDDRGVFERRFTAEPGDFVGLHLGVDDRDRVAFTLSRRIREGYLARP